MSDVREVLVPPQRWPRWCENFAERHGGATSEVVHGVLHGRAADGSTYEARLPWERAWDEARVGDLPPQRWGVLLVRKGGFAVARLEGARTAESKVGQRHVQGRTKAGGQSQQRFARRRENQAQAAYDAAAGHAARVLLGVRLVVTGGDHDGVETVLGDRRLAHVTVLPPWLSVPDPRRSVLEQAVRDAGSVRVRVVNAAAAGSRD